jgi:hypothetical protein
MKSSFKKRILCGVKLLDKLDLSKKQETYLSVHEVYKTETMNLLYF